MVMGVPVLTGRSIRQLQLQPKAVHSAHHAHGLQRDKVADTEDGGGRLGDDSDAVSGVGLVLLNGAHAIWRGEWMG